MSPEQSDTDSELITRLRSDLTTALKARDRLRADTIRGVLTAVSRAETSGTEAVRLTENQVRDVVISEAKKRRESAEAYRNADRPELADKEEAEGAVLAEYLPAALSDEEISKLVADAIASTGAAELGVRGMGKVMGVVTPQTKGRADGKAVADEVKRQLSA
ncbi:GatB/YqeY domain-containing protein [Microlunatus elymi]|uniref:GatB/YqeY domain-containing protein n=1 Tax=Microlunatus elymi TaxID=2596828 RepID=A0A516PV69_9ACTN|nr:GatB/YqeY domain-containing protein [Microlunatus elymi]QDP95087.1 GatB/YqeY domain-containing protein [Microlunatus elymi]